MGFFAFFGSLMIGGIVGYLAEKWDLTHNGVLPSIIIALGGVVLLFMVRVMFHLSFGSPGVDANPRPTKRRSTLRQSRPHQHLGPRSPPDRSRQAGS